MGTQGASGSEDCAFCQIANNQTDAEILLSDDELLCFRDIKPSATHHYLVVPRTHINNCKTLQGNDVPLVERMEKMGRSILEKNKVSNLNDVRMGFHVPPFSSVPPPPPPRSGSSQYHEFQVAASLRATVSLVHPSGQSSFSVEDPRQGQIKRYKIQPEGATVYFYVDRLFIAIPLH